MPNNTGYTREEIAKQKILGSFHNEWRQRNVSIYEHPEHDYEVITIGYPCDGVSEPIICVEKKSLFFRYIR